jgi:hypothetical protein
MDLFLLLSGNKEGDIQQENGIATPTIVPNYYPIQCTEFQKLPNGTIKYNYLGKSNSPNVVYASSSSAVGNIPLGYQATELYLCPTGQAMRETFPFSGVPPQNDGAVVIAHRPLTNGFALYSVFPLENGAVETKNVATLKSLFHPIDYTKTTYQHEPIELSMQEFVDNGTIVYENEKDHLGQPCIVVIYTYPISLAMRGDKEGFTVQKSNDPGYTYQECTMMPVDGIYEDGNGDVQYSYQVSADSQLINSNMENSMVFNASGIVMYFIITIAIYFGVPILYKVLLCNILANINTGNSFIQYLRRSQYFLWFGQLTGVAVIFNALYVFAIIGFSLAGSASTKNKWSLYSTTVFMVLAWVIGYMGIQNNPLRPECYA